MTCHYSWPVLEAYMRANYPSCFTKATESGHLPLCDALGISAGMLSNYRERGTVTSLAADAMAVQIGLHPAWIWGLDEWISGAAHEPKCSVCGTFVSMGNGSGHVTRYCSPEHKRQWKTMLDRDRKLKKRIEQKGSQQPS